MYTATELYDGLQNNMDPLKVKPWSNADQLIYIKWELHPMAVIKTEANVNCNCQAQKIISQYYFSMLSCEDITNESTYSMIDCRTLNL
jgi:hypothetical protein